MKCEFVSILEMHSDGNAALNKSTGSSSVYDNLHPFGPELAVDGVLDPGYGDGGYGCFITIWEAQPYLQIDLEREYQIIFIRMFNRAHCCGNASSFSLKSYLS
jgi:hypothetical protein